MVGGPGGRPPEEGSMSDETTTPTAATAHPAPAAADGAAPPDPPPAHDATAAAPVADEVNTPTAALAVDHVAPSAMEPEPEPVAEPPAPATAEVAEFELAAPAAEAVAPEPTAEPPADTADPEPAAAIDRGDDTEGEVDEGQPAAAEEVGAGEAAEADEAVAADRTVSPVADLDREDQAVDEPAAEEPEPAAADGVAPAGDAPPAEPPAESKKKWYVVKVQSNREESIKAAVERQVKIQGLEEFFGQIVIPVEEYYEKKKVSVKDKKTGQKVTEERNVAKHRKKFPGYLFAEVEFNDRILYVFRETSGVGDFVGATHHRAPSPMPDREVQQMLTGVVDPNNKDPKRKVKVKLNFEKGDKVRIREGAFSGSEAEVKAISEPKDPTDSPKVTVVVTIWGRPVEMEMDSFQVDKA